MNNLPEVTTAVEDVAGAVLRAANDNGPTLRYPAGADSVAGAKMRAEAVWTAVSEGRALP
jgi:hypothetical protein